LDILIRVSRSIALREEELEFRFVRSSGPGGQNVNKVATAVQLRFDVRGSASLPEGVKERLASLAGRRMSEEGVLILDARRFRTQERNRADALARLIGLLREAVRIPPTRHKTRPPAAARRERLEAKKHRGKVKRLRATPPEDS
jgi:ribosome-associated protein